MAKNSWYKSYAELSQSEREGLSYTRRAINRKSGIAIIAPHGGGIEPGTSELAKAIAGYIFSYYTFEGIKPTGNELLHITSTCFDEPKCLQLVKSSHTVIAIHGCAENNPAIFIGGLNEPFITSITNGLVSAGFDIRPAGSSMSASHPQNICNQGASGKGVQLEISEGLRRLMFKGLTRQERKITTPTFRRFIGAMRKVLLTYSKVQGLDHRLFFTLFYPWLR